MLHDIITCIAIFFVTAAGIALLGQSPPSDQLGTVSPLFQPSTKKSIPARVARSLSGALALVKSIPAGDLSLVDTPGELGLADRSQAAPELIPLPKRTDAEPVVGARPAAQAAAPAVTLHTSWLVQRIADPKTPVRVAVDYLQMVLDHSVDPQEKRAALIAAMGSNKLELRQEGVEVLRQMSWLAQDKGSSKHSG